VLRVRVDRGHR